MEFILEEHEEKNVSQELALAELREFVKEHRSLNLDDSKLLSDYPAVINAMEGGNTVLGETPVHKLFKPIKSDEGTVIVNDLSFKTRIVPSEQRKISKGLDLKTDQLLYGHRCIAFLTGLPTVNLLDKLSKKDYAVVEQLSTLFT